LLLRLLASSVRAPHGLELLQLVRGENGSELGLRVLVDGPELFPALVWREAGIGAQRGDLLLLGGQNGLELRSLIGGEAEALSDVLRSLLRIEAAVMAAT
jgi:hypothetical protein